LFCVQFDGFFPLNFVRNENVKPDKFSRNSINVFTSNLRFFSLAGKVNPREESEAAEGGCWSMKRREATAAQAGWKRAEG
jgi:hypothetical protein